MTASNAISSRTGNPGAATRNEESSSTTERFALRGPSANLDPRYHAFRGDLADAALANRLFAPHYAKPVIRSSSAASQLLAKPNFSAEVLGQLQPGEEFALLDVTGGWAWGYRTSDHLVGYLRDEDLSAVA